MAELPVRWSREAQLDLKGIADYVALDHPANAQVVFERLLERAASLATLASRGRLVPEVRKKAEPPLRELIEGPWRILYAIDARVVLVTGIVDSRRDVAAWLKERFGLD